MTHVPKSLRGMSRFTTSAQAYLSEKLTDKQFETVYLPVNHSFHIVLYNVSLRFWDSLIKPELCRFADVNQCDFRMTSMNESPGPGIVNVCCVVKRLDGGG